MSKSQVEDLYLQVPQNLSMKVNFTTRLGAIASLGLSGLVLAGCGGGNGNITTPTPVPSPVPQNVPSANVVALSNDNVLSFFNSRTPFNVSSRTVTGLGSDEALIGIDYRFAPIAGATSGAGLFGLARTGSGGQARLVRINISNNAAAATTVGSAFTLPFGGSNIGFDFNPLVDRIRVVDSSSRTNLRINPDTGALVDGNPDVVGSQTDGTLTYDATDVGNGTVPRLVGAAYTNNVVGTTSTINYAIDAARGALVTQGRPASGSSAAVSPNTGRLFSVGTLSNTVGGGDGLGFDIAPGSNNAFVAYSGDGSNPRLYAINLSNATATGGASISLGGDRPLRGLAIIP